MMIHERRWRYMYVLKCLCKSVGSELSTGGPNAHPTIMISISTQDFVEVLTTK